MRKFGTERNNLKRLKHFTKHLYCAQSKFKTTTQIRQLKTPKQYVRQKDMQKIITGVARITWRAQQSPLLAQQK